MIAINLNSNSQLFLTTDEATNLAINLTDQIPADSEIMIADERLTIEEGWRVLRSIKKAIEDVDWKVEGF